MQSKHLEPSWLIDRAFHATLGRLPYFNRYAPDIELVGNSDEVVRDAIHDHIARLSAVGTAMPRFLDIGARDGTRAEFAKGCKYVGMDVSPLGEDIIAADICHCPELPDAGFDIVFSFDVFEHLQRPWDAAAECVRLAKPGGLIVCRTLFAYRYHPDPLDYWRFSSQCLEYLFTNGGTAETVLKGYDVRGRRRNRRGVSAHQRTPLDWMGGFRENWQALWIGRKTGA